MLLPALQKARQRAKTTTCINNIKQIGLDLRRYSDDHDDYILPSYDSNRKTTWYGTLKKYNYIPASHFKRNTSLFLEHSHYRCPEVDERNALATSMLGYGMNALSFYNKYRKPASIQQPSRRCYVADNKPDDGGGYQVTCATSKTYHIIPKHSGNSYNVVYLDGHVQNNNYLFTAIDTAVVNSEAYYFWGSSTM